MKIKIDEATIKELPDDIAALMIVDPSYGREIPDLNASEVNALIHGVLASIYDPDLNFEQNLESIRNRYSTITRPSNEAMCFALTLIEKYKDEISEDEIGMVDFEDLYQEVKEDQLLFDRK